METYEIDVRGMSCESCEETVVTALKKVDGVHRVEADHETDRVEVTADSGTEDSVQQAIHKAGYDIAEA
jgi:copper chaperone